ncbi:MAG: tRNA uridine-5-carboxymethylaminomethyl(34) synthesis GTPase MnmE [Clostridia bacterium]|nr:tRNA uridine-5-carboxymethylaminomethyl(34) synthesis GTPase MnmE [Clostridia bacterium]
MSTIAAIATPNAAGGIGIIRISGEDAINITEKCFKSISGKPVSGMKGYTAAYGTVFDSDSDIDHAVVIIYRAPKSYTGENVAEICCHGGLYIMQKVLRLVFSLGAVPAAPGEFTKRAFLNNKMDLAQAESVMNIISAQGESSLNAARNTLKGNLSKRIDTIASSLVAAAGALAAWADYPDEDIPAVENGELLKTIENALSELDALISRYDSGKAVTEGVNTVICGKPNVGKSTLMNLLTGYTRSIVTSTAGTTRDVIEETVRVGNIVLRLADTAGVRETEDEIESIGVDIAKEKVSNADLVLAVFDISREKDEEDEEILKLCENKTAVAIINKTDLPAVFSEEEISEYIPSVINLSAKNEKDCSKLEEALNSVLGTEGLDFTQELLANERQRRCCINARDNLSEAKFALLSGLTVDAVNVNIDCAVQELFTLTGKKASEEIVNEVFTKFCVGK